MLQDAGRGRCHTAGEIIAQSECESPFHTAFKNDVFIFLAVKIAVLVPFRQASIKGRIAKI